MAIPLDFVDAVSAARETRVEELPPPGYMAVPILAGGRVVGAIRCSAANDPPYYYAERELRLLQVAASDIGHYWDSWMRHLELNAESEAWRLFIDRVRELNDRMHGSMAGPIPAEASIDAQFRAVSDKASAEAMTALLDQQKNLYERLFQELRAREESAEAERRLYEDLFHQLKSPIFTAAATARSALNRDRTTDIYLSNLRILRGQLLKAERVTRGCKFLRSRRRVGRRSRSWRR